MKTPVFLKLAPRKGLAVTIFDQRLTQAAQKAGLSTIPKITFQEGFWPGVRPGQKYHVHPVNPVRVFIPTLFN